MPQTVLVIDDNPESLDLISRSLAQASYRVLSADSSHRGIASARRDKPDLIVLSLVNTDMDGRSICKQLKRDTKTAGIPLLVMTLDDPQGHEITYQKYGADDFIRDVHLPTDPEEVLLAHCRRLLPEVLSVGDMSLDYDAKLVRIGRREFSHLTSQQFRLLWCLAKQSPRPVPHLALFREVCGRDPEKQQPIFKKRLQQEVALPDYRILDVLVRHIRSKLSLDDRWLLAVRGRGYKLVPPGDH